MISVTAYANRTVAVFGLARSGLEAVRALMAGGAEVLAFDDSEPRVAEARDQGFPVADLHAADWSKLDALVLSPGVPLTHPNPHWTVERAREAGVPVIGDTELFFAERARVAPDAPVVGITGTNGKSTTTALIGHLLLMAGRTVSVGGNIGKAVLSLEPLSPERTYVLELSSYQIDLTPTLTPSVGVLLNVTPDHLDRHGSMENYAAIKARIGEAADKAVIAVDDDWTTGTADRLEADGRSVTRVSATKPLDTGISVADGKVHLADHGAATTIADLSKAPALRGRHNAQNAAVAAAVALALGLTTEEIAAGLASFPGLAHRMEQVGRVGKVLFVNDSKATNADAAARSLASFQAIHWIAGGRAKSGGIEPLRDYFSRIRRAYLIGEAAGSFAATLGDAVAHEICGDLDRAVQAAARNAEREDVTEDGAAEPVVLLAPACASFDQFPDFEARGEAFRDAVTRLDGFAPVAANSETGEAA